MDMENWGVTETGFNCPTVDDILNAKNILAKEEFGDDFDTDEKTPEGMFFRINAKAESKLCEIAEGIYYSIFPHTATGVSLDRVCEFVNLTRDSAGHAQHTIRVYGTEGYIVEAGTEFKNMEGIEFYSVMTTTIDQSDESEELPRFYANLSVQCKQSGTIGNVNDINSTVEVTPSISSVEYLTVEAYGTPAETDPELRTKFKSVVKGLGTNSANAIIANVLRVAGVNNVILIDNTTDTDEIISDGLTVTAGTYAVIVHSDSTANEAEIAQAIFEKQPLGIPQSGAEEIIVTDNSNTDHTVKFTYVTTQNIDIAVTCKIDKSFTTSGIQEIKDNLAAYINSLGIGQEVVYTNLYEYIYKVTGVTKVTALTANNGTIDIPINKIEIAHAGEIGVTVEG